MCLALLLNLVCVRFQFPLVIIKHTYYYIVSVSPRLRFPTTDYALRFDQALHVTASHCYGPGTADRPL